MKFEKFLMFLVLTIFLMTGNCFARIPGNPDPETLADMNQNPRDYISYGGLGSGVSCYIYKNSIDVQKYAPPEYIIAFKNVNYVAIRGVVAKTSIERYKYNFEEKNIYFEVNYDDGRTEWKLLNTLSLQNGTGGEKSILAAGEIAFYLAYKMSFFDKPITYFAEKVINGNTRFFERS